MFKKNILLNLFYTFCKIGLFTLGGGYAMIALLHRECVKKNNWISSDELMEVTTIAESTPGPIALNCATYTGYKKYGILGALVATSAMILPSTIIIYIIYSIFENILSYPFIVNLFKGMHIGVAILIIQAGINMSIKILNKSKNKKKPVIVMSTFFTIFFFINIMKINFSTIYLIFIAAILGNYIYGNNKNFKTEGVK